jgi:hypothetical protein
VAFTCPRCGRVSHGPRDAAEGYCGACRDWTGPAPGGPSPGQVRVVADPSVPAGHVMLVSSRGLWQYIGHDDGELWFAERDGRAEVDLDAVRRYVLEQYNAAMASPGVPVTIPHTDSESLPEDDYDDSWGDAATWHPGYREL